MKELNLFLITKKYPWWHFWKKEERYTIAFDRALFVLVGYVDYNDYTVKYKEME